jgi:hypothetical protein
MLLRINKIANIGEAISLTFGHGASRGKISRIAGSKTFGGGNKLTTS